MQHFHLNQVIPSLTSSLVWKLLEERHAGSWLSRLPFRKIDIETAGTSRWSAWISLGHHRELRWAQLYGPSVPPCLSRGFTSIQMFHTHTPSRGKVGKLRSGQWDENEIERKWRWGEDGKWDESYLTRTQRGECKRRGKEQTPTQANLAQSGQTLKGQGKRKAEADGHRTRPADGGRTEAPKPTYHSETYAYLSTRRTQPTCREENTWNRGPMGD